MGFLDELLDRQQNQPIAQNLPSATASFQRKWTTLPPQYQAYGKALAPLIDIDAKRVAAGQYPMSARQTAYALMASVGNKAINKPDEGFHPIKNTFGDARKLLTGLVHLPWSLAHEIEQAPKIPGAISEALDQPSLGAKVAGVAQAPGVRFIPGAYTVGSIASGHAKELANHPLFTLLDLLPAADKALELGGVEGGVKGGLSTVSNETAIGKRLNEVANERNVGKGPHDIARTHNVQSRTVAQQMADLHPIYEELPKDLTAEDRARLTKISDIGKPEDYAALKPREAQFLDTVRQMNDLRAQMSGSEEQLFEHGGEWYNKDQARPMTRAQKAEEVALAKAEKLKSTIDRRDAQYGKKLERFGALYDHIPEAPDPEFIDKNLQLLEHLQQPLAFQKGATKGIFDGEKAGFVQARQLFATGEYDKAAVAARRGMRRLATAATKDPMLVGLHDALKPTAQMFEDMAASQKAKPKIEKMGATLQDLEAKQADRQATYEGHMETAKTAGETYKELLRTTPSKRWFYAVNDRFRQLAAEHATSSALGGSDELGAASADLREALSQPEYEAIREPITRAIREGDMAAAGLSARKALGLWKEASAEWQTMRDELGLNPIYRHSVSPEQISLIEHPVIYPERIDTVTQYRTQSRFAKPAVEDHIISMKHADFERFRNEAQLKIQEHILQSYGTSLRTLTERYRPIARAMIEAGKVSPAVGEDALVQTLIKEKYGNWKAEGLFPEQPVRITGPFQAGLDDATHVPQWVLKTMRGMYPKEYSGALGVLDKGTGLWRTFILPFSPRFHIYNIVGGGISTSVHTSPYAIFKYANEARKMVRDGELPIEISRGTAVMPADLAQESASVGYIMGNAWSRMKAAKVLTAAADKMFEANGIVDNFYRSIAYLSDYDKAIKKDLSPEVAHLEGIKSANKVLQDWDSMLPFERTTVRMIFPFYGWMKHILKFTMSLPVDHPLRVSIMSAMGRAEIEDFGDALPEQLMSLVRVPFMHHKKSALGTEWMVNLRGANPFADVANYFSFAGFLSQTNPFIEGALNAAGINPATGKPQSYAQQVYNPVTGRNEAKTPQLGWSIATSIIPVLEPALQALGVGPGAELARLDPAAAQQRALSRIGLPTALFPRAYNLPQEAAKAELNRLASSDQAYSDALRTGRYGAANKYPLLRQRLRAVQALPPNLLQMYALSRSPQQLTR